MITMEAWVGLVDNRGKSIGGRQLCTFSSNGVSQTMLAFPIHDNVFLTGFDISTSPLGPALIIGELSVPAHANPHDTVEFQNKSIKIDFGGSLNPEALFKPTTSQESDMTLWSAEPVTFAEPQTPYPELEKWAEETGNYFSRYR